MMHSTALVLLSCTLFGACESDSDRAHREYLSKLTHLTWVFVDQHQVRIPAGTASGSVFRCPDEPHDEWVDEFEIDVFPVSADAFRAWWEANPAHQKQEHPFGGGPYSLALANKPEAAARYCESRGMDLPTLGELYRATRGSRESFIWGDEWNRVQVCFQWLNEGTCRVTSQFGVQFLLKNDAFFGEWTRIHRCPDDRPYDRPLWRDPTDPSRSLTKQRFPGFVAYGLSGRYPHDPYYYPEGFFHCVRRRGHPRPVDE